MDAIKHVANSLTEQDQQRGQIEDIEMGSIAEDELLDEKFSLQGTSTGKSSGKKKVVSFHDEMLADIRYCYCVVV